MQGKTVLITGGNSGIGKAAAVALTNLGAHVIITSRNMERGRQAVDDIKQATGKQVDLLQLDLASFDSIHDCADAFIKKYHHLHVLVNNAGLTLSERTETAEGFEYVLGVNHIGPFLLTHLLLDTLKRSAPARIVNMSSAGHMGARKGLDWDDLQRTKKYNGQAYCQAKLGTIYFTQALQKRFSDEGVTAYAINPKFVTTGFAADGDTSGIEKLFFKLGKFWMLTPEEGAKTLVWAAAEPGIEAQGGNYFQDCAVRKPSKAAHDQQASERFWELSEQWIRDAHP